MIDDLETLRSLAQLCPGCYIFEYDNQGKGGFEHVKKTKQGCWRSIDHPEQPAKLHLGIMAIKRYQCEEGRVLKEKAVTYHTPAGNISNPTEAEKIYHCGICDRIIED